MVAKPMLWLLAILGVPCALRSQVVTPTGATAAQAAAAAQGRQVTNGDIANAIKSSGLTEQQIRDKLKSAGYDPALADPFFSASAASASHPSDSTSKTGAVAKALIDLGILGAVDQVRAAPLTGDSTVKTDQPAAPSVVAPPRPQAHAGEVFGKSFFSTTSTQFDPITSGPVDPSYRLGIADQLQIIVTGQVNLAFAAEIQRDGTILVPEVGPVELAGLHLDDARSILKTRMAHSYASLNTGGAILDLTISKIRSNLVYITGEVEQQGAQQVNALSTVFHALARAGGPTSIGSFRRIELNRGGKTVRTIDLYDYLLRGDASNDVRTESGDIIFVPLNTRSISIEGAVRRPAIFELKPGETFKDLLEFAGGLLPTASLDRVQIDRVLPPALRRPGVEREKIDVRLPLGGSLDSLHAIQLNDSDIITVFAIGDLRRNVVSISGAVYHIGDYQLTAGMTLDSLLDRAQGATPWALTDRIKVSRVVMATGLTESFSLDLASPAARGFRMAEFDHVLVLDGRVAYPAGTVSVGGAVRKPFTGPFGEHMRLTDAIDLADGLAEWALPDRIKIERSDLGTSRLQLFNEDFRTDSGKAFPLQRGDVITVLDARTAFPRRDVTVSGAVVTATVHPYNVGETLKDAIDESGGFRRDASAVAVARRRDDRSYNDTTSIVYSFPVDSTRGLTPQAAGFVLQPDDHITVRSTPGFRSQAFVMLSGMFAFPGPYAITENRDRVGDLVARAGGTLPGAYPLSFRLMRHGEPVAIDFARAMRGDRNNDIELRGGDSLTIANDPTTVFVTGAVTHPSLVLFKPGQSVADYIELAGGPTDKGQEDRAVVEYPSGFSRRVTRTGFFFHTSPSVVSGAIITVPERPENKSNSSETFTRMFGAVTALASLILAYAAVTRH